MHSDFTAMLIIKQLGILQLKFLVLINYEHVTFLKNIFPNSTQSATQRCNVDSPITLPVNADRSRDCSWSREKNPCQHLGFIIWIPFVT